VSLFAFRKRLQALGHFPTAYKNIDQLKLHFSQQLDKLVANRFIEFKPDRGPDAASGSTGYEANVSGSGAIAQGPKATAVGARGVNVGGKNKGSINTGIQKNVVTPGGAYIEGTVNTGGGPFAGRDMIARGFSPRDVEALFAPLLKVVTERAPADNQVEAEQQVEQLKAEVTKGDHADDRRIGKIVEGLVTMVPGAVGTIVGIFATPILSGIAGPVTKYVLDKLKPS
jgi:hypothetical protein